MALGPMRGFTPFGSGVNTITQSQMQGVANQVAGAGIQSGAVSASGIGGGSSMSALSTGSKAIRLGLMGFDLAQSLSAASDYKTAAIAQANQARIIANENNQDELRQIRIFQNRTDSKIRAQASAGGFSGASASTLKIRNQQAHDALLLKIASNKTLDRTLMEIQRQESAARKAARGMKTKAITGAISSTLSILGG